MVHTISLEDYDRAVRVRDPYDQLHFHVSKGLIQKVGLEGAILAAFILDRKIQAREDGVLGRDGRFSFTVEDASQSLDLSPRSIRRAKKILIEQGVIRSLGLLGLPAREFFTISEKKTLCLDEYQKTHLPGGR